MATPGQLRAERWRCRLGLQRKLGPLAVGCFELKEVYVNAEGIHRWFEAAQEHHRVAQQHLCESA